MDTINITKTRQEWAAIVTELRNGTPREQGFGEKLNLNLMHGWNSAWDALITFDSPHFYKDSRMAEMIEGAERRLDAKEVD